MALTYDLTKIVDRNEKYPTVMRKGMGLQVERTDKDGNVTIEKREGEMEETMNPITQVLIFTTISTGISDITEKNVDEYYIRLQMYDQANGAGLLIDSEGKGRGLTYQEVKDHVGLKTNASPLTKAQYAKRISESLRRHAVDTLRHETKVTTNA